jgi:tripartite-type tricarboxylate transporter receptor subunit TctC
MQNAIRVNCLTGNVSASLAVISGDVDLIADLGPSAVPHIKAGRVRVLAVTTAQRSQAMPDVPTMAEAGVPGYDTFTWFGIVGPAGMSSEVVSKLHREIRSAFAGPEMRNRFEVLGSELVLSTPEEFSTFHKKEIAKWSKLIRETGMRPE